MRKSEFRQNYRKISRPQFHLSLLGSLASLRTGTWQQKWEHLKEGKAMANYTLELAQDAVCQIHTVHMTGRWFLPAQALRLNTNE